ncbi:hypothetical protein [Halobacterium sp. R2-5]|uniref:hypothetical protein n=1 Tax=Halobacterium sp. R2-5 TaxID=2715751 RepID=UPI00141DD2B6|nr:hypothetical protein [Halobacterium sp. R2-5]NIB99453.1 hypothetical protein [Halobacterium sp. R2-5]
MEENTEFVYSLSSQPYPNHMVKDAVRSIMSLKNWVSPGQITVYYTPPRNEHDLNALRELEVNIELVENEVEPFSLNILGKSTPYGEMWHLCKSDADTVVWLDNDTIVTRNIWEVIEGNYDFKARSEEDKSTDPGWYEMFEKFDRKPMDWRFNAGFLVFKNGIHKEIKEEWKILMESDLGYYNAPTMQDAHALALCVSKFRCEKMSPEEHIMEWGDKPKPNGYVYHYITGYDAKTQIRNAVRRRIPEPLKKKIRKWKSQGTPSMFSHK